MANIPTTIRYIKPGIYEKPTIIIQAENNPIILKQVIEAVGPRVQQIIESASMKALDRYNLRPGRVFGIGKDRFRIIELTGNVIVYKDLQRDRIEYEPVDELLKKWNLRGAFEVTQLDSIFEQLKTWLTPFLGAVMVTALISWLMKKLK